MNIAKSLLALTVLVGSSVAVKAAEPVEAIIKTSQGDIKIQLYMDQAPITVENFIKYANDGDYNDTIFHRVIKGFMIQGGGFTAEMLKTETRAPIANESKNGLKNQKYTLAMARTPQPNSATNQFFINTADNGFLNREEAPDGFGYAVFGKVVKGMEVVDAIDKAATDFKSGMKDVPTKPIFIKSVEILEKK